MENNFDLRKFLTENRLTENSRLINEGVMWHWDGDRNSLEEVPEDFKAAVKAKIGSLDVGSFDTAFDGIKNFHADEAGQGEQTFNSDLWADQIEMDFSEENAVKENEEENLELDRDYDKGGKFYSEDGAEAFRIQPFKMNDIEYTKHEANRMGRYIVGLDGQALEQFISDYMGAFEADKGETEDGQTFTEDGNYGPAPRDPRPEKETWDGGIEEMKNNNNFNLRKFLTENKLTSNSIKLSEED